MKLVIVTLIVFLVSADSAAAGEITLNYLGGRICAKCEITAGSQILAANVIIDLGMSQPLVIDKEFESSLEIPKGSAVTLIFSESCRVQNLPYRSTGLSDLKAFTKRYASQLGEVPVIGIVGLSAFDNKAVLLDIQDGVLKYGDVLGAGEDWRSVRWEQTESGFRVAVQPAADYTLQAGWTTGSYETWINAVCASIAGFSGGDFKRCDFAGLNLSDYTAIRPVPSVPQGYPDAVIGNSFWQNFRIIAEPASQTIWFREKSKISDLKEQVYFKALIDEDTDAIEAYLNKYPSSRLACEAAETLLGRRLNESPLDKKAIERACQCLIKTETAKDAAEKLIAFADGLFDKQQYEADIIPLLLEKAKTCSLKTTDALLADYEIEGRLGKYAVLKKDWTHARLHLLSALFGQPNNPLFNYWMGRYYEANGQLTRAWSRYLKACLSENPPREAITALGKLNNDPNLRGQFSMRDAQEFLEGYTPIYSPAELPEEFRSPAPTLVEAFICADDAASEPLELALQAVEDCNEMIMMNFHLGNPAPEPLETSASATAVKKYQVASAPALAVNGYRIDSNLISLQDSKSILNGIAAKKTSNTPALLKPEVKRLPGQEQNWTITVPLTGLENVGKCEIFLVERLCLLFAQNRIGLYHNVVRACLYNEKVRPDSGPIAATFSLNKIQSDIKAYTDNVQDSGKIRFNMTDDYIDANMSYVAAKIYASDGRLIAIGAQDLEKNYGGGDADE